MNHKKILTEVIKKALTAGWRNDGFTDLADPNDWRVYRDVLGDWKLDNAHDTGINIERIIFDHSLAKTLWGEEEEDTSYGHSLGAGVWKIRWKYHLQMMVVADDPIKYLGENL